MILKRIYDLNTISRSILGRRFILPDFDCNDCAVFPPTCILYESEMTEHNIIDNAKTIQIRSWKKSRADLYKKSHCTIYDVQKNP